jgi:hypothetical protein
MPTEAPPRLYATISNTVSGYNKWLPRAYLGQFLLKRDNQDRMTTDINDRRSQKFIQFSLPSIQ